MGWPVNYLREGYFVVHHDKNLMSKQYRQRIDELIDKILNGKELTPNDRQTLIFILNFIKNRESFTEDRDTIE